MNWRAKPLIILGDLAWVTVLGLISGAACVAIRLLFRLLQWLFTGHSGLLSHAAGALSSWHRVFIPVIGALAAMAIAELGHRFVKNGSEEYVEAVQKNGGHISFIPTLWRTFSSAFSIATGAAIGREGSMIQFATATTSWVGGRFRRSHLPLATQVACGAAAAVATAYQAPIAGVFFAAEIVMGSLVLPVLPLLLVASLSGWFISVLLLGRGPLFAVFEMPSVRLRADSTLIFLLLFPVLIGFAGPAYQWLIRSLRSTSRWPLPLLWSGVLVGVLSLKSTMVWGNGDAALLSMMQSSPAVDGLLIVLLLRLCATTFCVGTGTVGGVFTPTVFAGGAVGYLLAHLFHVANPLMAAVLGMGCLLAAATHAPLMAGFMTVELTGQWHLLPMVLVSCAVSWLVAQRLSSHSLYGIATTEPAKDEKDHGYREPSLVTSMPGARD
ncbi:chloride channel protein [Edaphobacter albus]|uniref:chloride channel protein n=1 Tax=Edaphobacter sp. 4G125 TaxID=2763071 RepID=UPI001647C987|nr:chloride channel protein [Edaphobacter sp. 4G125]QNI36599.1 chloride channel protein [Edaphobacter sp. 4G125]